MPDEVAAKLRGMPELPFTLTQNLSAALTDVLGIESEGSDSVVMLAVYVDAFAKEYGLSESLDIDIDPCERTQLDEPVMEVVNHYLAPTRVGDGGAANSDLGKVVPDAEAVREILYEAVSALADDLNARKTLNRNRPLTSTGLLYVAQVYWNLEATAARPRLPIRPDGVRDIPIPHAVNGDFAAMRWTDRVNQKGAYKSSGNSFRNQGARLAVLIARHLAAQTSPAPVPSRKLEARPTTGSTQPLEIALQQLVAKALTDGDPDDAYALTNSYLDIIKRRAEKNIARDFPCLHQLEDRW